jgi:hypothetical protein
MWVAVGVVMRMFAVRVVFRFCSGDNHPRGGGAGSVCFWPLVWRLFLDLDLVCVIVVLGVARRCVLLFLFGICATDFGARVFGEVLK